jgi:hypothetical protein
VTDFRDLVDPDDLSPQEELRLRRVHELLVQAGPPADLPPALLQPPTRLPVADVAEFPLPPSRRRTALVLLAAALALAAFGAGYLFGHSKAKPATFAVAHLVPLHGSSATALLKISDRDAAGNWPMKMQVRGLPKQTNRDAYYELWLTRSGKPTEACGQFRVHGKTTSVTFSVPWTARGVDGWVVTSQLPGQQRPGTIVLRT